MAFKIVPADLVTTGKLTGQYTLTGPFFQSPNYVPGASGWAVFPDGSVEFNNGTFRATVSAATIIGSTVENQSSNPRTSVNPDGSVTITNSAGVVIFRIAPDGTVTWYSAAGAQLMQMSPSGVLSITDPAHITFPSGASFEQAAGNLTSQIAGSSPNQFMQMLLNGPQSNVAGNTDWVQLQLDSAGGINVADANMEFVYVDTSGTPHLYAYMDSNGFHIAGQSFNTPADQTISATSDTLITGLEAPVAAGITYRFKVLVPVVANQTGGSAFIAMHGPAVSVCGAGFRYSGQVGTAVNWGTSLPAGGVAMNNGQATWLELAGVVAFSATGTVSVQAHTSSAADTFTTKLGSILELVPVT